MEDKDYEKAVRDHLDDVYRLARSITRSDADAADICQIVFLRLYQSRRHFEDGQHLKNWLLKCAANESKSLLRTVWKRRVQTDAQQEIINLSDSRQPEETEDPVLMDALAKLTKSERALIHLYYWQGYSAAEIGSLLSISPTAASARLYRARKKLKEQLEREESYHG